MMTNDNALPHLIGELPDYLRELAFAIATKLDVDFGMALSTLLSGMASGVHGLKVVRRPDGGLEPLALFFVVLSGAATGKTRTHKLVHAPHSAHDVLRYEHYQQAKSAGLQTRLRDVLQPLTNNRSLLECLEGVGHATALSAHEGKTVLGSHFFRNQLDVANVLWDGDDKVTLPRPTGDRLLAFNASLNMLLMVQPDTFSGYVEKHGRAARSVGFLARCLFTTAQGHVLPADLRTSDWSCIAEYHEKVAAYLKEQHDRLGSGTTEREEIGFSPAARVYWFQLAQEIKQRLGLQYCSAQDAASRAMQHVTRIAGTIHAYYPGTSEEGRMDASSDDSHDEAISLATLKAAWAIVEWHLAQFLRLFGPKPFVAFRSPKLDAQARRDKMIAEDAETIMKHFTKYCSKTGTSDASQAEIIARSGLYPARFKTALFHLTDQEHMVCEGSGKKARLRPGPRQFSSQTQFGQPLPSVSSL